MVLRVSTDSLLNRCDRVFSSTPDEIITKYDGPYLYTEKNKYLSYVHPLNLIGFNNDSTAELIRKTNEYCYSDSVTSIMIEVAETIRTVLPQFEAFHFTNSDALLNRLGVNFLDHISFARHPRYIPTVMKDLTILGAGISNGFPQYVIAGTKSALSRIGRQSSTTEGLCNIKSVLNFLAKPEANLEKFHEKAYFFMKRFNEIDPDIQLNPYFNTSSLLSLNCSPENYAIIKHETNKCGIIFDKLLAYNFYHDEFDDFTLSVIKDISFKIRSK